MPITQKQIAEKLGVSPQAVGFALNGSGNVAPEKRRAILEFAERMGYQRNEFARAVVTGKSRVIGVVLNGDVSESIGLFISGVLQAISEAGYAAKMLQIPYWSPPEQMEEAMASAIRRSAGWRLDGAIAIGLRSQTLDRFHDDLSRLGYPFVYIESAPRNETPLRTDDHSGLEAAIMRLRALGHSRIAFVSGTAEEALPRHRMNVFEQVMREQGLPVTPELLTYSSWFRPHLMTEAIRRVLSISPRPTAIIAAGDPIAMAAIGEIGRLGLRVPDDISVVGYGNLHLSAFSVPALSSIAQPFRDLGYAAVCELMKRIEPEHALANSPPPETLHETFIERDSTGPAPL